MDLIATVEGAIVAQGADSRNDFGGVSRLDPGFDVSFYGFRIRYWF